MFMRFHPTARVSVVMLLGSALMSVFRRTGLVRMLLGVGVLVRVLVRVHHVAMPMLVAMGVRMLMRFIRFHIFVSPLSPEPNRHDCRKGRRGCTEVTPSWHKAQLETGFTLIELLIVIAIIAVLAALLLPAFWSGREKAKVARAQQELQGIGLALEMYSDDNDGNLPAVRVNCNTDLATHWCQLPPELADYLGHGNQPGMAANMQDLFNPAHTYKYGAPGRQFLNGAPGGNYQLWVPDDLPTCASTNGHYYSSPKDSPVRWVIWSLGPRPDSPESLDDYAPMAARSWYRRTGGGGVIARFQTSDDIQFKTP